MGVARLAFCVVFIALFAPATSDRASGSEATASINTEDYFQVPADLLAHQHALARHSESIRAVRRLARRVKSASGWKTMKDAEMVSVDLKNVSDSFFYQNPHTGAVTNITSTYQTVSDTVYLDQVLSIASVACNDDVISVKFNVSLRRNVFKNGLSFGSKCAHYAPGIRVTGGHSFFCNSASLFFRQITSVSACFEDDASGRASFIELNTADVDPLTFYDSVSDFSLNGSMALVPKRLFRSQSKVDFFRLSRDMFEAKQMMKEKQRAAARANLRECDSSDPANCYDWSAGVSGAYAGITYQRRASPTSQLLLPRFVLSPPHNCTWHAAPAAAEFRRLTLSMQKSTFLITTTTPQRTKQLNLTSPSLVAVQQQQEGFQMVLQWVAWSAMCMLELNSLSGEKLT